jgi:hypothetical protein
MTVVKTVIAVSISRFIEQLPLLRLAASTHQIALVLLRKSSPTPKANMTRGDASCQLRTLRHNPKKPHVADSCQSHFP